MRDPLFDFFLFGMAFVGMLTTTALLGAAIWGEPVPKEEVEEALAEHLEKLNVSYRGISCGPGNFFGPRICEVSETVLTIRRYECKSGGCIRIQD